MQSRAWRLRRDGKKYREQVFKGTEKRRNRLLAGVHPDIRIHYENSDAKQMLPILLILAAVVLAASVLNYLLIVMGNTVTRAREMAVRKCYGAMPKSIFGITVSETLAHIIMALALAGALVYACKGSI